MTTQPLVSVVTPFYNEEKYLSQCIDSVLAQSYANWEYILVNNCSTDRSPDIAREYASRDNRIRIYSNEVLLAQQKNINHALRMISPDSKYCKIVFGDDWIFPECLRLMVEVAEGYPSVGIVGAYRLDDVKVNCDGLPYPSNFVRGHDACRLCLLKGNFLFASPTSVLFRSDVIRSRDPFYSESSLHEDSEACYEILYKLDFGFVHQVLTFTRRDNVSTRSIIMSFNPDILDQFIMVNKYGHLFLNDEELGAALKNISSDYFGFLGQKFLYRRDKGFWEYHKKGLQSIGYHLRWTTLAKYICWELVNLLFNPKMAVGRLVRHFAKR
ncbi:MAG: glycosyltransferase family 2 protein [Syntrophobacteraceae bacterium]